MNVQTLKAILNKNVSGQAGVKIIFKNKEYDLLSVVKGAESIGIVVNTGEIEEPEVKVKTEEGDE